MRWFSTLSLNQKLAALALLLGLGALFISPATGGAVSIRPDELARIVQTEVDHVTPDDLADWIVQGRADYRLIDLRDERSYAEYHIPGAELVPITQLADASLARNERIVLYSDGGIHSAQAWFLLRARGYRGVYILLGGWTSGVTRSSPPSWLPSRRRSRPSATSVSKRARPISAGRPASARAWHPSRCRWQPRRCPSRRLLPSPPQRPPPAPRRPLPGRRRKKAADPARPGPGGKRFRAARRNRLRVAPLAGEAGSAAVVSQLVYPSNRLSPVSAGPSGSGRRGDTARGAMPKSRLLNAVLAVVAAGWVVSPAVAADDKAAEILAQTRKALGGDKLEKLQGLAAEGTYRRVMGEREMSGDLELAFQLPDKYLRMETIGLDPSNPVRRFSGFNGTTVLESTSGGGGGMVFRTMAGPGPDGRELTPEEREQRRLRAVTRDFGRLLVVLTAGSSPAFPVEYTWAAVAESDDGKADVLEVKGPDGFSARLFVDQATHLPLMLSYREPLPRFQQFRSGGGPPPSREEIEKRMQEMRAAGPPPLADVQLFVSDHEKVGGVLLPKTLRRAVNGKTIEELQLTKLQVNPAFKADKFEKK
jgi:rhodanese-related sulfurtransferase